MASQRRAPCLSPLTPTSSLPPLRQLPSTSTEQIRKALENLRALYFPPRPPPLPKDFIIPKRHLPESLMHGSSSVPDSGYASADNDDDDDDDISTVQGTDVPCVVEAWSEQSNSDAEATLELLRADPFERAFAIKWVTGFIVRSDAWVEQTSMGGFDAEDEGLGEGEDTESSMRARLVEDATAVLSMFSTDEEEEEFDVTRTFQFPLGLNSTIDQAEMEGPSILKVELNDAPLSNDDHTSVGLQSWASSIILSEKVAASPSSFSLCPISSTGGERSLRLLELGAGTGLLSIVAAKILCEMTPLPTILATDYHPDVLENLKKNIRTNFPSPSRTSNSSVYPIDVKYFDWEYPSYDAPMNERFDIILAADVVYHPDHTRWIKSCVEKLLQLPRPYDSVKGGIFWLMIPIRCTGRHEGLYATVDAIFPNVIDEIDEHEPKLVILDKEEVCKRDGIGRADEGSYTLFKIGWHRRS